MNPNLDAFLARRLPFVGLAGWGVRFEDKSLAQKAFVQWLTAGRIEQIMGRLALAAEGVRNHNLRPRRICWKFEHMKLHLALRADGAVLALFVQNHAEARANSQTILEDFLNLPSDRPGSA